jgi:hypothetical protein
MGTHHAGDCASDSARAHVCVVCFFVLFCFFFGGGKGGLVTLESWFTRRPPRRTQSAYLLPPGTYPPMLSPPCLLLSAASGCPSCLGKLCTSCLAAWNFSRAPTQCRLAWRMRRPLPAVRHPPSLRSLLPAGRHRGTAAETQRANLCVMGWGGVGGRMGAGDRPKLPLARHTPDALAYPHPIPHPL